MKRVNKLAAIALGCATVGLLSIPAEARNPYGNSQVQAVVQSNFATRQAQLRAEISTKVSNGTLNPSTAASLLGQLDSINAETQNALFAGGGISNDEANRIVSMFGDVTNQLNANTSSSTAFGMFGNPYGYLSPSQMRSLQLQQHINSRVYPYGWMP